MGRKPNRTRVRARDFWGRVGFLTDDYGPIVHRFQQLQSAGRSGVPAPARGAGGCRWCGIDRVLTSWGAWLCVHCDQPHRKCGVCFTFLRVL